MSVLKSEFTQKLLAKLQAYYFTAAGHLLPEVAAQQALQLFMTPPKLHRGPTETHFWDHADRVPLPSGLDARSFGNPHDPEVWVVHGWGSRSSVLRNIIEALVIQNYYVIAWDAPAHGRDPQHTTNMLQVATLLQKDITIVGKTEVTLIGHSFGAGACAYVASRHDQVTKLITIGGVPDIRKVIFNFWKRIQLPPKAQKHFIDRIENTFGITPLELSPIHFHPQVKAKWLLIHDKNDEDVDFKGVEKLMNLKPSIQFLITENLGHYKILKNTWVITKIIQFLRTGTIN